jgi:hypothetical protein
VTKITKRPADARFKTFPEGDLLQHVKANQSRYLGAVFAIVREWIHHGRPRSDESRHDFREWTQSLDWIITEIMSMPPLMDGHREEQLRTANPQLQWLRLIAIEVIKTKAGVELSAMDIVEFADDTDIALPARAGTREEPHMTVGRIMKKVFRDAGSDHIIIESIKVQRTEREALQESGNWKPSKFYTFTP